MMEWPDLKIKEIAAFINRITGIGGEMIDGINMDVIFIIVALFTISYFLRKHGKSVDEHKTRLKDNNENLDDHTDSIIENTRSNHEVIRTNRDLMIAIERMTRAMEVYNEHNKKLHG